MNMDVLAQRTGIEINPTFKKEKRGTFDSLVAHINEEDKKKETDPLNYWKKIKIMFSTDVNAIADSEEKGETKTKFNRENYMKIIKSCISKTNIRFGKNGVKAYSVSEMNGCYVGENGISYDEKSYSLDILGLPDNIGEYLAKNIKDSFCQESVMFIVGENKKLLF